MSSNNKDDRLVKIAVAFINNPKVINAPDESKRQFLKKKGKHSEIFS
jgi:Peroxisomal membrane anchor protein (Pex14p) conserved region.